MPLKAIIYDIEINILKIHYDPIILKIKKDLNINLQKIKKLFFSPQFYFFTIGKVSFKSFIKTSFNELMLDDEYIIKLERKYKKSIEYRSEVKENIMAVSDLLGLKVYFSGDIDESIYSSVIKKDLSLSKISFFSCNMHSVKQESQFLEKLTNLLDFEENEILVVDDNLDVLLSAKDKSFLTLFYDGKRDFYSIIKMISENLI